MQYRPRRGIPEPIRNALDAEGPAFAFAYVDRNGRWRLDSLAPTQDW
jgi:hypothetical protein